MAFSFKHIDSLLKKRKVQMSRNSFEKLLDIISTNRSQYSYGLKHEIPLIYSADNQIPYIDKGISRFMGVSEEAIYQNHTMTLAGHLPAADQIVFATEIYKVLKYVLKRKTLNNLTCRAKMKVAKDDKTTYWVIFEVQEATGESNQLDASLSVMYDISQIHKDNLHKFIYYDKATQNIIYQNYYPSADIAYYQLTRRETQIINLLADGFTSVEIADKLGIGPETIRKHRKNVIQKLSDQIKIRNTPHLVKFAFQHGMIMDNSEFSNLWEKEEYVGSFQDYDYVRVGE